MDWLTWIHGKLFASHPIIGGIVVCALGALTAGILYLRILDKYNAEHLTPRVQDVAGNQGNSAASRRTREQSQDRRAEFPNIAIPGEKLILGHSTAADFRSASFKLDTSQFSPFAKDYSFILIGRVADNSVEVLNDPKIETSQPFTITDEVRTIQINFSEEFAIRAQAVAKRLHQVSIQYYFALIPKNIRAEQIHTITDITALGGQQLKSNPSPEFFVPPAKPTR